VTDSTLRDDIEEALSADYTILREYSRGSGLTTLAASSKDTPGDVEIKAVPVSMISGSALLNPAAYAARTIEHPNILPIIETGTNRNTFYWISPSAEAQTLRARLAKGSRVELKDSLTLLRDVSAALTHAHRHGVVHGGLSTDSVLISGGSALVADLGVAEVFAALRLEARTRELSGVAENSLGYAAPEQGSGGAPDARSDVYGWGVIAYELLGGRHPFVGRRTPREMMAAHAAEEPVQLSTARFNVPSNITRLVMRCLSKNPAERPESAREILDVLTREMLVPPPAAPAGSGQKVAIALIVALVAVMAVIGFLELAS